MTRTRYLLKDVGRALPESALLSFVTYLPPDSALMKELNEDNSWLTGQRTDMLLAAIYDQLAAFNYSYLRRNGSKVKRPKPLPRPGVKDSTKRIGKDPIPIESFNDWYYGGD